MIYTFNLLIDILFPPTEHEKIIRLITKENIPYFLKPLKVNNILTLCSYNQKEIRALVNACKFEKSFKAADILGKIFNVWLEGLPLKKTLIVPIPLSKKRLYERGFNQVEKSLKTIHHLPLEYKISSQIFYRNVHTTPQTSLNRQNRLKNIKGAFQFNKYAITYANSFKRIIICDDVLTTGATLDEARQIITNHISPDIEIICLAWAH